MEVANGSLMFFSSTLKPKVIQAKLERSNKLIKSGCKRTSQVFNKSLNTLNSMQAIGSDDKFSSVAVATLFVAVTFGSCAPYGQESSLLEQICDNHKFPSKELTSLSKLDEFVQQADSISCPQLIKSSMIDLHSLIMDHQGATCSQESANAIADYYSKYLAARDEQTNALIEYPRAMKPFFIAYGLQVSSFCRKQMVDLLVGDNSQQLIGPEDFQELADFIGDERGFIAALMGEPSDRNDLIMPENLVKMMKSFRRTKGASGQAEKERLFLEVPTTRRIKHLHSVCRRRFEPIYKELILPLVTLSTCGFNYKTQATNKRDSKVSKQIYQWYRVVFFCEAINGAEFFQMPQDQIKAARSFKQQVRILEKDEADKLRRAGLADTQDEGNNVKQIHYHPGMKSLKLDNVVYDDNDSRLYKAVMAFRRRTRKLNDPALTRRIIRVAKDSIMRPSVELFRGVTGLKSLPGHDRMTSVDITKLLSEYVVAS